MIQQIKTIPEEWKKVQFVDCIDLSSLKKLKGLKKSEYKNEGKYLILDQGQNFISGYTDNIEFVNKKYPAILFGDHTRIVKFIDFPFVAGADGTKIFQSKKENNPKFLYYSLLNLDIPNTGYNRHFKLVKESNILLPPFSEQTKIAEILSSVDEEIEKVNQEIKKTEELKRGLIQKLFKEGKKRQIKNVVLINSEQINPLNYPKAQYNYIDIASIEENEIKEVKQFLGENAPSRARRVIKTGDIIISTVRPNLRGFVYIEEKYNNFLCSTGFCVLRSDISKIESRFLYFLISNFKFTDFLVKKTTGSNYPAVNPSDIKEYEFNLPDTQRQKEITNFLSSVDNKIIINKQIKNKLAELKKGLMQDLLSGRVRVI